MAKKLKTDPIEQADLIEFLDEQSDFGFEIQVLKKLRRLGFECEHGGTYIDPATEKPRQFDIRATHRSDHYTTRLAVECKNLRKNFPLLISCMPRSADESFHEVILAEDKNNQTHRSNIGYPQPAAKTLRCGVENSIYKQGEFVGKSADQVGRSPDGEIISGDSEVYGKWSQAVASAQDLIGEPYLENELGEDGIFVLPILVIPDGTLWVTHFDAKGERLGRPETCSRCPFYIGKSYEAGDNLTGGLYRVSHLEFVTISGLQELSDLLSVEQLVFPRN